MLKSFPVISSTPVEAPQTNKASISRNVWLSDSEEKGEANVANITPFKCQIR